MFFKKVHEEYMTSLLELYKNERTSRHHWDCGHRRKGQLDSVVATVTDRVMAQPGTCVRSFVTLPRGQSPVFILRAVRRIDLGRPRRES